MPLTISTDISSPRRRRLLGSLDSQIARLDEIHGPLRTTGDGNLVQETTGDFVILSAPPHSAEDLAIAIEKNKHAAQGPKIILPEAKNGATGLDDPRSRKPLSRVLRNVFTGSNHPPKEDEVKTVEDAVKQEARSELASMREQPGKKIDMGVLGRLQKACGPKVAAKLGGDWYEHCLCDRAFSTKVLDLVANLSDHWIEDMMEMVGYGGS